MTRTKTVSVSSIFPATPEQIWERIARVETLQYIAAPYAAFTPVDESNVLLWQEGEAAQFRLYLFGFLPLGVHTIRVRRFDRAAGMISTEEGNRHVPVWNHEISIRPVEEGVNYTDTVAIGAGWKTGVVYAWSKLFYRHRQRKWEKLLSQNNRLLPR